MQGGAGAGQADRLGAEPEPEMEPEEEEENQEVTPPQREPTVETTPAPPVTTLPPR